LSYVVYNLLSLAFPFNFMPIRLSFLQLKSKTLNPSMKNPAIPSDKSLMPALFQIAARADDPESVVELRSALATGKMPLAEMMLNAEKLEAILKAIVRRKKPAARRASGSQKISAGDVRMA
jgi:hypothetical protein